MGAILHIDDEVDDGVQDCFDGAYHGHPAVQDDKSPMVPIGEPAQKVVSAGVEGQDRNVRIAENSGTVGYIGQELAIARREPGTGISDPVADDAQDEIDDEQVEHEDCLASRQIPEQLVKNAATASRDNFLVDEDGVEFGGE